MNERVAHALNVYLSKRWAIPIIGVAALIWSLIVFLMAGSDDVPPMVFCSFAGMPMMAVAFWVTSIAKWQFVNPRARLLPNFAMPHLVIIAGWLAIGMGCIPLILGSVLPGLHPLSTLAYGLVGGAFLIWAMHTAKPLPMLLGIAVYFLPVVSFTKPFWTGATPTMMAIALGACLAGVAAIALWLWELARITEESEEYFIPIQAQSGKASRMEKSASRRNVAMQLSRSKLSGMIVDRWNDSLHRKRATWVTDRRVLLPYGQNGMPAWVRVSWIMILMIGVVGINVLVAANSARSTVQIAAPTMLMFAFIGPAITTQLLAMRRPRMQTELLLPMTRRQYIDGLFRMVALEATQYLIAAIGLLGLTVAILAPEYLRIDWVIGVFVASLVGLTAVFGLSMRTALIDSGLKRMGLLLLGLYGIAALLSAVGAIYIYVGVLFAYGLGGLLFASGILLIRSSHRSWLNAEMG